LEISTSDRRVLPPRRVFAGRLGLRGGPSAIHRECVAEVQATPADRSSIRAGERSRSDAAGARPGNAWCVSRNNSAVTAFGRQPKGAAACAGSGRALVPPAIEAGSRHRKEARHVPEIAAQSPSPASISARLGRRPGGLIGVVHRASAEMFAWRGRGAAVPDRHGGLRRRALSQPQAVASRPQYPAAAGQIRPAV
jgi:hypothetical protein